MHYSEKVRAGVGQPDILVAFYEKRENDGSL
jgi:hypothetical protein